MKRLLKGWGWHLAPWAGLIGGALGWALSHQVGSILAQDRCQESGPLTVLLICLLGLVITAGGAFFSWRLWRRREDLPGTRSFLSLLSMFSAGLFALAILFQALAGLIIPSCLG
ncbi:MAG TPA: hypothetical protein VNT77_09080 [Allosphingosinicella sp.]|nr:hypothetical protein [Allosphingosinicella sp.]